MCKPSEVPSRCANHSRYRLGDTENLSSRSARLGLLGRSFRKIPPTSLLIQQDDAEKMTRGDGGRTHKMVFAWLNRRLALTSLQYFQYFHLLQITLFLFTIHSSSILLFPTSPPN